MFRALVLARIIEPTSKLDSLRVLEEVGVDPQGQLDPQPCARCVPDEAANQGYWQSLGAIVKTCGLISLRSGPGGRTAW